MKQWLYWRRTMLDKLILTQIAGTAEVMGSELSPTALAVLADDLAEFDNNTIIAGLRNLRKSKQRFSSGAVISEIEKLTPNARIGADEAWALYPHNEADSAVITNEMAEAMQVASPLLMEGDSVGARMAFKEAYNRIVEKNKAEGIAFNWFPSLGHCKEGREQALKDAANKGRISIEHAQSLLPSPKNTKLEQAIPQLQALTLQKPITAIEKEKHSERMNRIKSIFVEAG